MSEVGTLRSEAARVLGVSEEVSLEVARIAFLKQLTDSDFNPSASLLEAATELSIFHRVSRDHLRKKTEQAFRDRIEHFAQEQFWNLESEERFAEWKMLYERVAEFPRLRIRLRDLEPLVKLTQPSSDLGNESLKELAQNACKPRLLRLELHNARSDRVQIASLQKYLSTLSPTANIMPSPQPGSEQSVQRSKNSVATKIRSVFDRLRSISGITYIWTLIGLFIAINITVMIVRFNTASEQDIPSNKKTAPEKSSKPVRE